MYEKILVPLDGSELAEAAVPLALAVARATAGRLSLIHIADPGPVGRAQMPAPEQYLARVASAASDELNESIDTAVLSAGDSGDASKRVTAAQVASYAKENAFGLIVLSTSGRGGLKRVFAGSVAEALLWVTPCPVLFCRPHKGERMLRSGTHPIRKIVIALDQTDASEAVLGAAASFATEMNAEVVVLHVLDPTRAYATVTGLELAGYSPEEWAAMNERADAYLARVQQQLAAAGVQSTCEKLVSNDVAGEILDAVDRLKADAIALASRAPQRLARAVLGSVADRLVRNAPCPVLVIRADS